jgi:hypothetical protein
LTEINGKGSGKIKELSLATSKMKYIKILYNMELALGAFRITNSMSFMKIINRLG